MTTTRDLTDLLERSFHGGAWHGPAVAEALEGVDATTAARRPIPAAHNIWEIIHHLTIWHEVPLRRIDGDRGDELSAEDWCPVEEPSEESWQQVLDALRTAHRKLHARLAELTDEELERPVAGSDPTLRGMILGVIQHNAYHGGQIAVLRKSAGRP
ncbi:MAG: DinB family protein [Thermoanaerobaculia bacterium]